MTSKRIIYYYQTFNTIQPIIKTLSPTHIHLASIHFGLDKNQQPYIHLNDYPPDHKTFNNVWNELREITSKGIKVVLMVGGAGGAFTNLFKDFDTYYTLLYNTVKKYNDVITGIDLDIEEPVSLDNCRKLISRIDKDFDKNFLITMAPLGSSLASNNQGMGGFIYKDLYNTPEGKRINYFNGQFYGDFNEDMYNNCVNNNYPSEKVVIGMLNNPDDEFKPYEDVIKSLFEKYDDKFGGVFIWEYFNAIPGGLKNPEVWSVKLRDIMYPSNSSDNCSIS